MDFSEVDRRVKKLLKLEKKRENFSEFTAE